MPDLGGLLGAAIRERRAKLGFSQEEVAFRSELHRTYVTDIERGARNPSLRSIAKLAKALQVSIEDLFHQVEAYEGMREEPEFLRGSVVDILIAEDDPDDADLMVRALRKYNLSNSIYTVHSGSEAVDFIFRLGRYGQEQTRDHPLVLFLGLGLPGQNGLDVLRRVRGDARTADMPIVVMTSSDSQRDLEDSRELNVCQYLTKPVDSIQLGETIPRLGLDLLLVKQPVLIIDRNHH